MRFLQCFTALGLAAAIQVLPGSQAPLSPAERGQIAIALRIGPELKGLTDEALRQRALAFATEQAGLRVRPSRVDRLWAIEPAPRNLAAELEAAGRSGSIGVWLQSMTMQTSEAAALEEAYRRYSKIAAEGGWLSIDAKPNAATGWPDGLDQRLIVEGYLPPVSQNDPAQGADLAAALAAFQSRHGLRADGKFGPATREALNVSAQARADQIAANLERLRWLPRPLPPDRFVVDTGWQEATLYRAGKPVLSMRVIVGKPATKTAMFASNLEAVIFNPPWNVPAEIARNEVLPKAARQPGYWEKEGFVHTATGIQQRPGPRNALGQIKFDLPSPFGVYLHDTPSRNLFANSNRALSHGCMRLEKPRELAAALLGWPSQAVDDAVSSGQTKRLALPSRIPLFVVYRTVAVDGSGAASFHADTYGWDRRLVSALSEGEPKVASEQPRSTDCVGLDPRGAP